MKGWGWKKQRGPSRRPMTRAEIEEAKTKRHHESEATRLIREAERAKRAKSTAEVDALIRSESLAGAPRNVDLHKEYLEALETRQQVDDIIARGATVHLAVNQDGQGGAFIKPTHNKSPGLIRQFVGDLGRLFGRPVDTNRIDRVIAARPPGKK